MAKCTPELWSLKEIYESLSKGYNGEKKIVIPMFQRGKRWSSKQQESFIEWQGNIDWQMRSCGQREDSMD